MFCVFCVFCVCVCLVLYVCVYVCFTFCVLCCVPNLTYRDAAIYLIVQACSMTCLKCKRKSIIKNKALMRVLAYIKHRWKMCAHQFLLD